MLRADPNQNIQVCDDAIKLAQVPRADPNQNIQVCDDAIKLA